MTNRTVTHFVGKVAHTLEVTKEYTYRNERRYMVLDHGTGKSAPVIAEDFDRRFPKPTGIISRRSKGDPITKKRYKQ